MKIHFRSYIYEIAIFHSINGETCDKYEIAIYHCVNGKKYEQEKSSDIEQ